MGRGIPDRRCTTFSLLVDLSGSMEGAKAQSALCATALSIFEPLNTRVFAAGQSARQASAADKPAWRCSGK